MKKIKWIPNEIATVQDKILLWKILVRSSFNYGILILSEMKDSYKKVWIDKISTTFRKCIGLSKGFNKEVFDSIYNKKKTIERANKTNKIVDRKWKDYLESKPRNKN